MPGWWTSRSLQKHGTRDTASLTRLVRAARRAGADHRDVGWSTGREHPGLVQELVEERVVPVAAGPVVEQSSAAVRQLDAVDGSGAGDEAALGRHDQGDPLDGRGDVAFPTVPASSSPLRDGRGGLPPTTSRPLQRPTRREGLGSSPGRLPGSRPPAV
jgi:hypothetical protein